MTVILAMLQAMTATAIAPPVPLTPEATLAAPTLAARALSVATLDPSSATPVTVVLQCLSAAGEPRDCIPASDGGTVDPAAFRQRLSASRERAATDPVLAAALARVPYYETKPVRDSGEGIPSVLVRETISPADRGPGDRARGSVPKGEIAVEPNAIRVVLPRFYPRAALRAGAQARVTATCRVLGDRSLLCRDAKIDLPPFVGDPPSWRAPQFDAAFVQAATLALAGMRARPRTAAGQDSVGLESIFAVNWTLP